MLKQLRLLVAFLAMIAVPASAKDPKVGEMAPDFHLTLIDGTKVSLSDLKGQVVVLNFWATWCVPCRKELPLLDAYYASRKDTGLRVFAITTEDSLQPYQLKKLFAVMHISPVKRINGPYDDMNAVPTNFVIDRAGRLRYAKAASFSESDLNTIVQPLLKEPAPAG